MYSLRLATSTRGKLHSCWAWVPRAGSVSVWRPTPVPTMLTGCSRCSELSEQVTQCPAQHRVQRPDTCLTYILTAYRRCRHAPAEGGFMSVSRLAYAGLPLR